MTLSGQMFVAGSARYGKGEEFRAVDAESGAAIEPPFGGATGEDVEIACAAADAAFDDYRNKPLEDRARFLDAIAANLAALGDELVSRCSAETGLARSRVESELQRTTGQVRFFAEVVRAGDFLGLRIDPRLSDRKPLPRPDLRLRNIPLGPVAVFGASNFPLAFSVAGGDTASALAAGCPVVVKAHPAHPGTSELTARAIAAAVRECGMPAGVFSILYEPGYTIGQQLAADPRIKAIGFTGSRRAGLALLDIAQRRAEPIPVYAEMSSINPVLLMPAALAARAPAIAGSFVTTMQNCAGQFCTSPGLLLGIDGDGLDSFIATAREMIATAPAATMLTPGILKAYDAQVGVLAAHPSVTTLARGVARPHRGQPGLFLVSAADFMIHHELQEEVFGSSTVIVRCRDAAEMKQVIAQLEGQLTASIHATEEDYPALLPLLPLLERKVGRIVFDGFGTGVEVAHAIVHGGPFPATSDSRTTSVGGLAITRFLRPVSYQNLPKGIRSAIGVDDPALKP